MPGSGPSSFPAQLLCWNGQPDFHSGTTSVRFRSASHPFSSMVESAFLIRRRWEFNSLNGYPWPRALLVEHSDCRSERRGFDSRRGRDAPVAQLVELRTFNPKVVGSIPTGRTTGKVNQTGVWDRLLSESRPNGLGDRALVFPPPSPRKVMRTGVRHRLENGWSHANGMGIDTSAFHHLFGARIPSSVTSNM